MLEAAGALQGDDGGDSVRRDFDVLEDANAFLLQNLRKDEMAAELANRFQSGMGPSSHNYFCGIVPKLSAAPHVRHAGITPWPPQLSEQFARVEVMTFMGLLPEIGHAWMSVDNQLFLWDYEQTQNFQSYGGMQDVILTVGLAPARSSVFRDVVKYVLVVATTTQIRILAAIYPDSVAGTAAASGVDADATAAAAGGPLPPAPPPPPPAKWGRMAVRPTNFMTPTDGMVVTCIAAHPNGRIFLGGRDGSFVELVYRNDRSGIFQRSVGAVLNFGLGPIWAPRGSQRACHTVTHAGGRAVWLPTFLSSLTRTGSWLAGSNVGGGAVLAIAVDPFRGALYLADEKGGLELFDMDESTGMSMASRARIDLWVAAREFCSRSSGFRASLPGALHFDPGHGFTIAGLHVVDPSESSRVSLLVIASSGFRIFLGTTRQMNQLMVLHVRAPPPTNLWQHLQEAHAMNRAGSAADGNSSRGAAAASAAIGPGRDAGNGGGGGGAAGGVGGSVPKHPEPPDGFAPSFAKSSSMAQIHTTLYSHGFTLMADGIGDEAGALVAIAFDPVGRRRPRQDRGGLVAASDAAATAQMMQTPDPPSMRELVDELGDGRVQPTVGGAIWALKEEAPLLKDPSAAGIVALLTASQTPTESDVQAQRHRLESSAAPPAGRGPFGAIVRGYSTAPREATFPVPPPPPPLCLPAGGARSDGRRGFPGKWEPTPLPEVATQHLLPTRVALCLNAAGVHRIVRVRPIDRLRELLQQGDQAGVRMIFNELGAEEAAAACFSVACGLPATGFPAGTGTALAVPDALEEDVRRRAIDALRALGGEPRLQGAQSGGAGVGVGGMGATFLVEQYFPSHRYDGLVLFLSRLLRPIWFRLVAINVPTAAANAPAAGYKRSADGTARQHVAGEGAAGAEQNGKGVWLRLLLDEAQIRTLGAPLAALLKCVAELYPEAVNAADAAGGAGAGASGGPGGGGGSDSGFGTGDGRRLLLPRGSAGSMMHALESRGREFRGGQVRQSGVLLRESRDVHIVYRLASRASQALALLSEIARAYDAFEGRFDASGVAAGMVAGPAMLALRQLRDINFWQLVVSESAHRRAEAAIVHLVTPSEQLQGEVADQVADRLGEFCFFYFSGGDVKENEAMRSLRRAEEIALRAVHSEEYREALRDGIDKLKLAASWWRAPSDALGPNSALSRACRVLRKLSAYSAAIDLCLICADNFPPQPVAPVASNYMGGNALTSYVPPGASLGGALMASSDGARTNGDRGLNVPAWMVGLYHGRPAAAQDQRMEVRSACYNQICDTMRELVRRLRHPGIGPSPVSDGPLQGTEEASMQGLTTALSAALCSEDREFHYRLYDLLRELGETEVLLKVATVFIEDYLRLADVELLGKYYSQHKRHLDASKLFESKAFEVGADAAAGGGLSLQERRDCLGRAMTEAKLGGEERSDHMRNLQDRLDMLCVQMQVGSALHEAAEELKAMGSKSRNPATIQAASSAARQRQEAAARLSREPLVATELFNSYALPFALWRSCVVILATCQYDDPQLMKRLWQAIILRHLPRRAVDGATQAWLDDHRARRWDQFFEDEVSDLRAALQDEQSSAVTWRPAVGDFEEGSWIEEMCTDVRDTARQVQWYLAYQTGLPAALLVYEMEPLVAIWSQVTGKRMDHVVARTLRDAGESYRVLVQEYFDACYNDGNDPTMTTSVKVHFAYELSTLLRQWLAAAFLDAPLRAALRTNDSELMAEKKERRSLQEANTDGALVDRIQRLKTLLQASYGPGVTHEKINECAGALDTILQRLASVS